MAIYNGLYADGSRVWGSPSGWCVANGFVDGVYGIPGGDWDTYYAAVKANVAKDGNTYAHDYDVYGSTPEGENIPVPYVLQGKTSLTHAICLDRAIYEADKVYSELEAANYHCYAVSSAKNCLVNPSVMTMTYFLLSSTSLSASSIFCAFKRPACKLVPLLIFPSFKPL